MNLNGGICPIVVRPALWQPVDPSLVYCYEIQGLGLGEYYRVISSEMFQSAPH